MLGHACGVSQFTQLHEIIKKKYQLLPRPYVGSYSGEKGHIFARSMDYCITKQVKKFVMVSISEMPKIKY